MNYWQITLKHNKEWNPHWVCYIDCITDLLTTSNKATMLGNCFESVSKQGKIHFHCIVTSRFINFNKWQQKWLAKGMYVYIQVVDPKTGLRRVEQYQSKQHLTLDECEEIWHTREVEEGYSFVDAEPFNKQSCRKSRVIYDSGQVRARHTKA